MTWLTETGSATWTRKGTLLYSLPGTPVAARAVLDPVPPLREPALAREQPWAQPCTLHLRGQDVPGPHNVREQCGVRWVEIPPGTISVLKFFVRSAAGEVVDLVEMGCSISFILTIAPRGAGG